MSEEFVKLQKLVQEEKLELRLKKFLKDCFGIYLYWVCNTKPAASNLFGKAFILYWVITSDWFWIILAVIFAIKFTPWFLILILVPFILTKLLEPVGLKMVITAVLENENLFEDLWKNQMIGIMSTKMRESVLHSGGVPEIIIDPINKNWKIEINKL